VRTGHAAHPMASCASSVGTRFHQIYDERLSPNLVSRASRPRLATKGIVDKRCPTAPKAGGPGERLNPGRTDIGAPDQ